MIDQIIKNEKEISDRSIMMLESHHGLRFGAVDLELIKYIPSIPTAEKFLSENIGYTIQSFNNGNFKFCVHTRSKESGNMIPDLDSSLYPTEKDSVHGKNDFGRVDTMMRCIEHLKGIVNNEESN